MAETLDEALLTLQTARELKEPRSVALLGNAAEVLPSCWRGGSSVDVLTDQTSAHDTLNGYVPAHIPYEEAVALRAARLRTVHPAGTAIDRRTCPGHDRIE